MNTILFLLLLAVVLGFLLWRAIPTRPRERTPVQRQQAIRSHQHDAAVQLRVARNEYVSAVRSRVKDKMHDGV